MSVHNPRGAVLATAALVSLAAAMLPPAAHAQGATVKGGSYLGGEGVDRVTGVAQTPSGEVVVVGNTNSTDPTSTGGLGVSSSQDVFVARFNADGSIKHVPKVFGGSAFEEANGVAIGPAGEAYIVGQTWSGTISGVTATKGSYSNGQADGFLAKVTPDGTVEWFMYLPGTVEDVATAVWVTGTTAYVVGWTSSASFMSSQGSLHNSEDAFVVKVDLTSSLDPASQARVVFGGDKPDKLFAITPGPTGKLLMAGSTSSLEFYAPAVGATVGSFHGPTGGTDALVASVDPSTLAVDWVSYLGGTDNDDARAIVTLPNGQLAVAGTTASTLVPNPPLGQNGFVAWLNTAGEQQRISVFGGNDLDVVAGATLDSTGNLYVVGKTASDDFPLRQPFDNGMESGAPRLEGFIYVLPADGGPGWSSFVGGSASDELTGVSLLNKRLVVAGQTSSGNGLILPPSYDMTRGNPPDGFVLDLDVRDITPPDAGMVNDGPGTDLASQDSTQPISANWTGFTDTESNIAYYEWAIGIEGEPLDGPLQYTRVSPDLAMSATDTKLTPVVGKTYYVSIRATNGAGMTRVDRSNGVLITEPGGMADGGMADGGAIDGGQGDGGTSDGGTGDGGTNGTDGGEIKDKPTPPIGWELGCASTGAAGVPLILGFIVLVLVARRRGHPSR